MILGICFILFIALCVAMALINDAMRYSNKYSGIILPPKPKKSSSHTCKMPFFQKPEGTLYRCPTCFEVWRRTSDFDWHKASLNDWTNAGGSSK